MKISFNGSPKDKVFLIVGAAGGIGEELSLRLAKGGATLLLAGRNKERLEKLQQQLDSLVEAPPTKASRAHVLLLDVRSPGSVQRAIAEAFSISPVINYVIHAAGYFTPYAFEDVPEEEKKQTYLTNIYGPFIVSEEVLSYWRTAPYFKSMLFFSSIAGIKALPNQRPVYAFSKRMVIELFQKYYSCLGEKINFSCFCPGPTETPMWKEVCARLSAYERISPQEVCRRYEAAGGLIWTVPETVDRLLAFLAEENNGVLYAPVLKMREKQEKKENFEELDYTLQLIGKSWV